MIKTKLSGKTVSGEYNLQGYMVTTQRHGKVMATYYAGNNKHDSQQPALTPQDTESLSTIRRHCVKTCREIAAEKNGTFAGVTRIADGE